MYLYSLIDFSDEMMSHVDSSDCPIPTRATVQGLPHVEMALCWMKTQLALKASLDLTTTHKMCIRCTVGHVAILFHHHLPSGVAAKLFQAISFLVPVKIRRSCNTHAAGYRECPLKLLQQPLIQT